ncbi:hypothetical protein EOPP23_08795 [Endozoicomonas sp. OPT23]|uniref:NAD(P)H-binding protein n=1 Tax=Endozoicomonas sp. OPT23 TaxID=2072845 RepID=UPI00129ACE85|nr:NAD(P)H-binding protein [Endozoicomonas sp. OPT23]MRI33079.1 hypothetical protein [Endozoicomonas sp. OPT23]
MSKKERISVVGYGRVGLPLGRELKTRGYDVYGTVTSEEKCQSLKEEGLNADVLTFTPEANGDLDKAVAADILVATLPPSAKLEGQFNKVMETIAEAAARSEVKKVLLISATSVYQQTGEVVREEDATHQASPFLGTSWLKIEELFSLRTEFETTVVRFSGLMGQGINAGVYFAGRELKGANQPINMIHLDDCVAVMAEIIDRQLWGEAFNASADEHPCKRDFYTKACTVAGMELPLFSEEAVPYRIVNCDKLKKCLGYTFKYPDPMQGL